MHVLNAIVAIFKRVMQNIQGINKDFLVQTML